MKKLTLLMCVAILLSSCSNYAGLNVMEIEGVNIFDKDNEFAANYKTENIILKNLTEKRYSEAAYIYDSGSIVNMPVKGSLDIDISTGLNGIYLYDEFFSITNAYDDTKLFLENDDKVILVLLDGFSNNQYNYALEKGYIKFLDKYYKHEALSVYKPVTNAGYAAIITGKTPDINGIHDRSNREMNVNSIFHYTLNNNKKSIILEGDIKILNTEIEPVLHIDLNKDGDTDDEMFESALTAANEHYDLIFVHFHGVDDRGHSYGPYSDKTMNYILRVDSYIERLSEIWDGKIILTSDHGMHETSEGGNHGDCIASDMIVPYFIIER